MGVTFRLFALSPQLFKLHTALLLGEGLLGRFRGFPSLEQRRRLGLRWPVPKVNWTDDAKFNAIINGLMGAMAFLYGEGDFTKTVGIATAAGYDADNQPATIGGALGVMHGSKKIPRHFTHDINGNHWSRPFNDKYVNERRDNLPRESSITDIVNRIKRITVKAILAGGGKETGGGSSKKYQVKVSKELSCPNTCV